MSPTCVVPGRLVTLTVDTEPYAMVIFQAVYSDGGGGGPPPYGSGYGGNAGGPSDPQGSYESAWTVSPEAPAGSVEVEVYVGGPENGQGHELLEFEVVEDLSTC